MARKHCYTAGATTFFLRGFECAQFGALPTNMWPENTATQEGAIACFLLRGFESARGPVLCLKIYGRKTLLRRGSYRVFFVVFFGQFLDRFILCRNYVFFCRLLEDFVGVGIIFASISRSEGALGACV